MKVTLIRHGISVGNTDGLLFGWTDGDLAKEGEEELIRLRESVDYPEGDVYYCSDLLRCKRTLALLYPDVKEVRYRKGLREIFYGKYEGVSRNDVPFEFIYDRWLYGVRLADEESRMEFGKRAMETLSSIFDECEERYENVVVVTHTGVIKHILLTLQGLDTDRYFKIRVGNGRGFTLDLEKADGNIVLRSIVSV